MGSIAKRFVMPVLRNTGLLMALLLRTTVLLMALLVVITGLLMALLLIIVTFLLVLVSLMALLLTMVALRLLLVSSTRAWNKERVRWILRECTERVLLRLASPPY
jgi:hypothetical protein